MDNQHRQIKGYLELSQEEIDLMNRVKAEGVRLQALVVDLKQHVTNQYTAASGMDRVDQEEEHARLLTANPYAWINLAEMELQTALMKLTRSVAQPTFF
ncbi:Acb2/Tad1 domain-containing protein [Paraburkholderia caribensis]|uniref:Acb2/Tad1 domain-containing protein n=1 Tax=Paraburkholderia caribensis TaxID=75105 RepID=UPI0034D38216